jgi:hypothetical protein
MIMIVKTKNFLIFICRYKLAKHIDDCPEIYNAKKMPPSAGAPWPMGDNGKVEVGMLGQSL